MVEIVCGYIFYYLNCLKQLHVVLGWIIVRLTLMSIVWSEIRCICAFKLREMKNGLWKYNIFLKIQGNLGNRSCVPTSPGLPYYYWKFMLWQRSLSPRNSQELRKYILWKTHIRYISGSKLLNWGLRFQKKLVWKYFKSMKLYKSVEANIKDPF